jgi:hypothetical protein
LCQNAASSSGYDVRIIDKHDGEACPSGWTEKVWNQTGPQGPRGETGAAGAPGPQGPPGPGLPEQPIYTNGSSDTISAGERVTINSFCGEDNNFSSGGGVRIDEITSGDHLDESHWAVCTPGDNRQGWEVTVSAPSDNADVIAFAEVQCFRPH